MSHILFRKFYKILVIKQNWHCMYVSELIGLPIMHEDHQSLLFSTLIYQRFLPPESIRLHA
jgi:hypothetical protein